MSNKSNTTWGYVVASLFILFELVIIYFGYMKWEWPPSILIPTIGLLTFFGVLIIVNLFSKSSEIVRGEFRSAIAASLLVVYFFLVSVTLFTSDEVPGPWKLVNFVDKQVRVESPKPDDPNKPSNQNSEEGKTKTTTKDDIVNNLLDNYNTLIIYVVAFYFGGRTVEEVTKEVRKMKGGNGNDSQTGSDKKKPLVAEDQGQESKQV